MLLPKPLLALHRNARYYRYKEADGALVYRDSVCPFCGGKPDGGRRRDTVRAARGGGPLIGPCPR